MTRKRNGEGGFNSLIAEKVEVLPQVKTKFFKEGKVVLPEDFENEMESHHHCGSDAEEISRINNSDSLDLAILIASSEKIPLTQAQKLVQSFY